MFFIYLHLDFLVLPPMNQTFPILKTGTYIIFLNILHSDFTLNLKAQMKRIFNTFTSDTFVMLKKVYI